MHCWLESRSHYLDFISCLGIAKKMMDENKLGIGQRKFYLEGITSYGNRTEI